MFMVRQFPLVRGSFHASARRTSIRARERGLDLASIRRDFERQGRPMAAERSADYVEEPVSGPQVGSLYLCTDGTRVRVTGRTWAIVDTADVIQVCIERRGMDVEEQLTASEFAALVATAQVTF